MYARGFVSFKKVRGPGIIDEVEGIKQDTPKA